METTPSRYKDPFKWLTSPNRCSSIHTAWGLNPAIMFKEPEYLPPLPHHIGMFGLMLKCSPSMFVLKYTSIVPLGKGRTKVHICDF